MKTENTNTFLRFAKITLWLTYAVIIAGAVVRATGSGMGCPDWPKCFGQYIPPTSVEQLPEKYKVMHQNGEMVFNVYQTYTEYINRLMGALLGLSVFILLLLSTKFFKTHRSLFWYTLLSFLLIGFQGWLGAKVVSSNLAPVKITTHMVVALVIVALFVFLIQQIKPATAQLSKKIKLLLWVTILLSVFQIIMGTQVREQVDEIAKRFDDRNSWPQYLDIWFYVHRSFSIVVLVLNLLVYFKIRQAFNSSLTLFAQMLLILIGLEIISGIVLNYFGVPAFIQPIHLLLAAIIFGIQCRLVFSR